MRLNIPLRALALAAATAGAIACGSESAAPGSVGLAPSPTPAQPPAAAGHYAVRVANGITNTPVAAATVRVAGETLAADALGRVELPTAAACMPATLIAVGFLDRRIACLPTGSATFTPTVTLWPVESEAERDALRAFAFPGDQLVRRGTLQLEARSQPADQAATVAVWQRAARLLDAASAAHFTAVIPIDVESAQDGTIVMPWTQLSDCVGTRAAWFGVSGFCAGRYTGSAYPYFISVVRVAPERLRDEAVALRVLLSEFRFGPHPGPGLMNERHPDDTLSDFERRTLQMIRLRDRPDPGSIGWPDTER